MGDEVVLEYEFLSFGAVEEAEDEWEDERRKEVRMWEMEEVRDWKRVVCILMLLCGGVCSICVCVWWLMRW